ncbi:MAG: hypothetical protein SAqTSB_40530 [Shewanella algae]|uniref:hypothetical protein n=1 Tax=Shewanella algae TaxID=38313 RepID=UPI0031F52767
MPKLKPQPNENGIYDTKALSAAQFRAVFDQIAKDKNKARRRAKRTLTPGAMSRKSPRDLLRLGVKDDGTPFTSADLALFERESKKFRQRNAGEQGVTYLQIVAKSRSIDVKRANNQVNDGSGITRAQMGSLVANNIYEAKVKASRKSKYTHHRVRIRLEEWDEEMMDADGTQKGYQKAVKTACKGRMSIDCSCGRHQFWYRYMATVGGYAITPPKEMAFPKIRNNKLTGLACKHVIKVVEMMQSPAWQRPMAMQMERQASRVGFGSDKRLTHHFTKDEKKAGNRNKRTVTDQAAAREAYRKYLKSVSGLAKKIKSSPAEAKRIRDQLAKAKKDVSKAQKEAARLKAQNAILLKKAMQTKDALKVNAQSFIDGAALAGIGRDQALAAFAKKKGIPLETLNTILESKT